MKSGEIAEYLAANLLILIMLIFVSTGSNIIDCIGFSLFGGASQRELEPSEIEQLLQELDDWADILRSEPEMVLALSAFPKAAGAEGSEPDGSPIPPPSAGPSP